MPTLELLTEGTLVETAQEPGVVKNLIKTTQWLAGRARIYVTVAVEFATGERRCYAVNALRPTGW